MKNTKSEKVSSLDKYVEIVTREMNSRIQQATRIACCVRVESHVIRNCLEQFGPEEFMLDIIATQRLGADGTKVIIELSPIMDRIELIRQVERYKPGSFWTLEGDIKVDWVHKELRVMDPVLSEIPEKFSHAARHPVVDAHEDSLVWIEASEG